MTARPEGPAPGGTARKCTRSSRHLLRSTQPTPAPAGSSSRLPATLACYGLSIELSDYALHQGATLTDGNSPAILASRDPGKLGTWLRDEEAAVGADAHSHVRISARRKLRRVLNLPRLSRPGGLRNAASEARFRYSVRGARSSPDW